MIKSVASYTSHTFINNNCVKTEFIPWRRTCRVIRDNSAAGDCKYSCIGQCPFQVSGSSVFNNFFAFRFIQRFIIFGIARDDMISGFNLGFAHCAPPVNGLIVVCFCDDYASCALFQNNHAVAVVIYPKDITDFYIFKFKAALCDCPCG